MRCQGRPAVQQAMTLGQKCQLSVQRTGRKLVWLVQSKQGREEEGVWWKVGRGLVGHGKEFGSGFTDKSHGGF